MREDIVIDSVHRWLLFMFLAGGCEGVKLHVHVTRQGFHVSGYGGGNLAEGGAVVRVGLPTGTHQVVSACVVKETILKTALFLGLQGRTLVLGLRPCGLWLWTLVEPLSFGYTRPCMDSSGGIQYSETSEQQPPLGTSPSAFVEN